MSAPLVGRGFFLEHPEPSEVTRAASEEPPVFPRWLVPALDLSRLHPP
jgi:hypothetical protein